MSALKGIWEWLKANKAKLGAVLTAVYLYVVAQQDLMAIINTHTLWKHLIGVTGVVLAAAGLFPSDRAIKKFGEDAK